MTDKNGDASRGAGKETLSARNARVGLMLAGIALLFFFGIMVKYLLLR